MTVLWGDDCSRFVSDGPHVIEIKRASNCAVLGACKSGLPDRPHSPGIEWRALGDRPHAKRGEGFTEFVLLDRQIINPAQAVLFECDDPEPVARQHTRQTLQ